MNRVPLESFAYPPKEAARLCNIGLTTLYAEIRAGRIKARKCGSRTLISSDAIREWIAALPVVAGSIAA